MLSKKLSGWVRGRRETAVFPQAKLPRTTRKDSVGAESEAASTSVAELTQKIGYLSAMEAFQDLAPEEMAWLDQVTTMITCERGRLIYMPEETGEVLFLLKKGRVQIYRLSADGKKLVIATLGGGTLFGEMSLIGQGMYQTFAEAVEDCTLCAMGRHDVEQLLVRKPQVALRILEILGRRLVDAEAMLEDLAFKSVPARLASILVRLSHRHGLEIVGITHQELAEMAGTYRETATLTLNELKAAGLIDLRRKRITVRNLEGLREIAGG